MSNNNDDTLRSYYDILVSNLNSQTLSSNDTLTFFETRDNGNPFVLNASNYLFSIQRFSLETNNLPIWFCDIQVNQENINLSIYSISMEYNGIISQEYLIYIPQDKTSTLPSNTLNGLQPYSDYYFVYNYEYLIYLLNNTLTSCFNKLASLTNLPTTQIPYLKWNSTNNTASLISDNAGFNDISNDYIKLYFNNALFNLFQSFCSYTINSTSDQGLIYQISCSCYGIAEKTTINNITYLICPQEFSTISVWNPVVSIVFISNTLPIKPENIGAPLIFLNNYKYQSTNNKNVAGIITDFQANDTYKPYILYQPTVLRYIELQGNSPINKIDIKVYWKNRIGDLIDFKLNCNNSMSMKIAFSRIFTQN